MKNQPKMLSMRRTAQRFWQRTGRTALSVAVMVWAGLAAMPAAADDLDIYTRSVASAGEGTADGPVVHLAVDTSCIAALNIFATANSINCPVASTHSAMPVNLLQERSAGMKDAFRSVATSGGPKLNISMTDFGASNNDYVNGKDNGKLLYEQKKLGASDGENTAVFPTAPVDTRITSAAGDASQRAGGLLFSNSENGFQIGGALTLKQLAGFYFPDIKIPRNATITSATLTVPRSANSGTVNFNVKLDSNTNPASFTAASDVSSRTLGTSVATGSIGATDAVINVTSLIQQQVNRAGWCPGRAVAAVMTVTDASGITSSATLRTWEGGASTSARLQVSFTLNSSTTLSGCSFTYNTTMTMGSFSDDVTQLPNGEMNNSGKYVPQTATKGKRTGTEIDKRTLLKVGGGHKSALRFILAPIAPGSTITSAKLRLMPKGTDGTGANALSVFGILDPKGNGNVDAFMPDNFSLDALTLTSTSVSSWTPATWGNANNTTAWVEIDVTALAQAQVNQLGWRSDNTLGFLLTGGTKVMQACAWEHQNGSGANAALSVDGKLYSDFGTCSAQLVMTVSNNGTPLVKTHRQSFVTAVMNLRKDGRQPTSGAYLKGARYLAGKNAGFAADQIPDGTYDTGTPVRPILASGNCSKSAIVLIADLKEDARYADNFMSEYSTFATSVGGTVSTGGGTLAANKSLAQLLHDGFTPEGGGGLAFINTFTINYSGTAGGAGGVEQGTPDIYAMDNGGGFLRFAQSGGGAFKQAVSSAQLVKLLIAIINSVSSDGASVAAPGVSVNALNRFEHLDQLYYALFKPSTKVDWQGNLKRYRLKNGTSVDIFGQPAADTDKTGYFADTAWSYWTDGEPETDADGVTTIVGADGSSTTMGGAAGENYTDDLASELPEPQATEKIRRIYTYLGSNGTSLNTNLTDQVVAANSNITLNLLGIDQLPDYNDPEGILATAEQRAARRSAVIDFLRATPRDPASDTHWGASIHGSPRIVTFNSNGTNPITTVFYADNRGLLHAIDAGELSSDDADVNMANTGGEELFAFLPKELLKNAAVLHENTRQVAVDGYVTGLDGDITLYREDSNYDGNLDRVLAFVGMRRGGSNYYAVDVSNARRDVPYAQRIPKIQWIIQGGTGSFVDMGQTWSAMVPATVYWNNQTRRVLFFSGGYDPLYHDDGSFSNVVGKGFTNVLQKGRRVYMVDMETGAYLWSTADVTGLDASSTTAIGQMKYSITASPRLLDRNADGYTDAVYISDLAGQVFRIELSKAATNASTLASRVVLVAQVGATAAGAVSPADNRRFYDSPSLSRVGDDIMIALVSGYREEPYSVATKEAAFFLKDAKAYLGPYNNSPIVLSAIDNITGNAVAAPADMTKPGWYYYLNQAKGEKGIGSPIIFNYALLFTTYVNDSTSDLTCAPNVGKSYLYMMDFSGRGLLEDGSRSMDIELPGMADTPQVLFQAGDTLAISVGVRVMDAESICGVGLVCPLASDGLWSRWRRSRWFLVEPD